MTVSQLSDIDLADHPLAKLAKESWKWLLGLGVVALCIGILALAWPGATVVVVAIMFGIYLLVSGVIQLINAFAEGIPGGMRFLYIISGGLSLLLGVMCFRSELQSVLMLGVWIGVGWIMSGISQVIVAISARSGTPGRGWTGFGGAIITLGGIVLIASPLTSVVSLAIVVGCFLLVAGIVQVIEALQLRKAVRSA